MTADNILHAERLSCQNSECVNAQFSLLKITAKETPTNIHRVQLMNQ